MLREAGYVIDHEHNHLDQCWWEMRPASTQGGHAPPGSVAGDKDVRLRADWPTDPAKLDRYRKANDPDDKLS